MQLLDNETPNYLRNIDFDEAISHKVHSRIFEILGYLAIIDKNKISDDDKECFLRIEQLCKMLVDETQLIIDYYKAKKTSSI
ncbi:MAG: hypothetical protein Q8903_06455 [Bacteroidota bacterium]|nr:hypothetical protein [Bacteroidota bacterium]